MADTARPLAGPDTTPHAKAIAAELAWLAEVIEARLKHFFEGRATPFAPPPAPRPDPVSALGRLILALAMAPHVNSAILDPFFVRNTAIARVFSQFGGVHAEAGAFQPTAETALFLLAGADTAARIAAMALFDPDHPLRRLAGVTPGGPQAQALTMPVHRVIALCEGRPPRSDLSPGFPAQRLNTRLTWGDWGLARHVGHGFKALFYGPPAPARR
ncbi:hypothetical protein [Rhodovulum marinum]|uniref:Uncharacterized protein n=1 Tax=Rhodovulum marinum TaxID=320662 RepID=A0A4R2PVQ9_9RHOB|nr:hypothetical protein [Rhodovulum marinum]TCP40193.1 hypothetical protein EV662_10867 [Rhodovulum marinum]